MSKLKEIFPEKFKLIVDSGKGYKYSFGKTDDFNAKTVIGDEVIAETNEAIDKYKGQYLQNDYGGVVEYKSMGDLLSAEMNVTQYDDFVGSNYMDTEGFVIIDKNLNIAYKSNGEDYTRAKLMNNKIAMLKLVYNYGPCALAHMHPSAMKDEEFKQLIGKTLDKRALKLQENNPEKIEEEVAQIKELLKYFEQENQRKAETGFFSRSLF